MKKLSFIALIGFSAILLSIAPTKTTGDGALEAQVNTMKQECKELIKECRYEGSKVTYYIPGSKQNKSIELFLFLAKDYQFAVSAKKSTVPVTLKIYDAASDVKDRNLIKEFKNVQGKNTVVNSSELNKLYRKKMPEVERLKNVHVEYSIGAGKGGKEAIVLVYGHKA